MKTSGWMITLIVVVIVALSFVLWRQQMIVLPAIAIPTPKMPTAHL